MAKPVASQSLIDSIRSKYGMRETQWIDSGIFQFNELFGGGIPLGKIIELVLS